MENENILSFDSNSGAPLTINILVSGYEETRPTIMSLKLTSEKVIMDFFKDDQHVGTTGRTYEEWLELSMSTPVPKPRRRV